MVTLYEFLLYSTNIYYCMGTVEPYRTVLYSTVVVVGV